jgi:hypothetical protein
MVNETSHERLAEQICQVCRNQNFESISLKLFPSFFAGPVVLRSPLAVEELGGWQDPRAHDGPRHWRRAGRREEAEEEAAAGLPRGQPQAPQLVGVQILLLRVPRAR